MRKKTMKTAILACIALVAMALTTPVFAEGTLVDVNTASGGRTRSNQWNWTR